MIKIHVGLDVHKKSIRGGDDFARLRNPLVEFGKPVEIVRMVRRLKSKAIKG